MRTKTFLLLGLLLLPANSLAQYTKVISVNPATDRACIAIEIPTDGGSSLTGLRWFANDGEQVFPRVVIVEGQAGSPPDLTNPGLILDEVTGVSMQWRELLLDFPVTSSTGTAHAVFFFPEGQTTHALGTGGGPGIGLRATENPNAAFYLSSDAEQWVRFDPGYELGVEPVTVLARGTAHTIAAVGRTIQLPDPQPSLPDLPRVTTLHPPVPNPFNPRVTLAFSLADPTNVDLKVYDLRGRVVRVLVSGQRAAGEHIEVWDGVDHQGRVVASGVYFVRFTAASITQTHRMVLVR